MNTLRVGSLVSFEEVIWTVVGVDTMITSDGRSGYLFARTDPVESPESPIPLGGDAWYVIDERPFGPATEMLVRTVKKAVRRAGAELNAHLADRGANEIIARQREAEDLQRKTLDFVRTLQAHWATCPTCRKERDDEAKRGVRQDTQGDPGGDRRDDAG